MLKTSIGDLLIETWLIWKILLIWYMSACYTKRCIGWRGEIWKNVQLRLISMWYWHTVPYTRLWFTCVYAWNMHGRGMRRLDLNAFASDEDTHDTNLKLGLRWDERYCNNRVVYISCRPNCKRICVVKLNSSKEGTEIETKAMCVSWCRNMPRYFAQDIISDAEGSYVKTKR